MAKIAKLNKFWHTRAFIFAFEVAFIFCFFIGIFWNPAMKDGVFNEKNWYYINRGYPSPWSGVSKSTSSVDFPLVKAPFLGSEVEGNTSFTKIIDLGVFLPLFMLALLLAYPIGFVFSKAVDEGWNFNFILIPIYLLLALFCYFCYFLLFPGI